MNDQVNRDAASDVPTPETADGGSGSTPCSFSAIKPETLESQSHDRFANSSMLGLQSPRPEMGPLFEQTCHPNSLSTSNDSSVYELRCSHQTSHLDSVCLDTDGGHQLNLCEDIYEKEVRPFASGQLTDHEREALRDYLCATPNTDACWCGQNPLESVTNPSPHNASCTRQSMQVCKPIGCTEAQVVVRSQTLPLKTNDQVNRDAAKDVPTPETADGGSGSTPCSAFIRKAIEAGYSQEDAKQFYNDVVEHRAVGSIVSFLLRRPDCFKAGVVKTMNDALSPWTKNQNLVMTDASRPVIPQVL